MEIKQEVSETCKIETETCDGPLDAFKIEIKEEPMRESAYHASDYFGLDKPLNEFPINTEVEQDEYKFTLFEEKQTTNEEKTEARKCWKNLRQEYGKQLKKIQSRSGYGAEDEEVSQWPYFEKLDFLRDQFTPHQSSTNLIDETQDSMYSHSDEPNHLEESDSDDEGSTSTLLTNVISSNSDSQGVIPSTSTSSHVTSINSTISQTGYKRRITPQIEIGKPLVDIEKEKLALRANKLTQNPNDDDIGFFNSLLPYVKQLTPRSKLKFRIDVQNYLYGLLFPPREQSQASLLIPPP
ncbi:uncharacterized protein [Diabrotica undecimpunctata]|uniref:uncharacterized protein isoform X2 n=1 Tax=Diabrotica undecimpunctata TaxID=50387 RepID=UPI003B63FDF9